MKNWDFSKLLVFCAALVLVFGILVLQVCRSQGWTQEQITQLIEMQNIIVMG